MDLKCSTGVLVGKLRWKWTIDDFSLCSVEETGYFITSPEISYKTNSEHKYMLKLYPRGNKKECEDYVSLFLVLISDCGTNVRTTIRLSILNAKGNKTTEREGTVNFSQEHRAWGCSTFIKLDILFDEKQFLLPNDMLTISCEVTDSTDSINSSGENKPVQVPECSLSKDFGRLFEDEQLSDVILSTPSKEYKAHKAILAARSPVFAAMFQHEMEENKSNRVDIADVDEEVLEEVLRYMYTGKAHNLDKMADKLLIAADKYDMKSLKALCEKSLCDNLVVGNAADSLIIADLHGAEVLKERAIIFINRYLVEITETAGWRKMLFSHHLVTEVCRASVKPMFIDSDEEQETKANCS